MALSNDLISQFVKITNDKKEEKKESTVYGTAVIQNGVTYVKLDGSTLLTPATSAANTKDGERVIVMIKDHTATITGNVSSPSARIDDITDQSDAITELEILVADKVTTAELDAANARIDTLVSEDVLIKNRLIASEADIDILQANSLEIRDDLTATNAVITHLQTDKLDAAIAVATYATIKDLEVTNEKVYNLEATYGEFADLTTDRLDAVEGTIDKLDSTYATITDLKTERARIDVLEADALRANSAIIKDLQSDVANIDTLIFGSASGNVIQTSFANAVIAQLGNAQIKSAMIESVSADKITAGDIITNNVRVMSEDGKLLISDETLQISDTARVRVQIGKDASGDYSINVWDTEGNLMFSAGGITDKAIKEAIIRNDMVSDTANIAAHKLDIASLFEEINGSTQTIKSSKIFMDSEAQTLDVVFTEMTSQVDEIDGAVTSQGTAISVIQGQIANKIWLQDIDAEGDITETLYSVLAQRLDEVDIIVANHTNDIDSVNNQVSAIIVDLDGFKSSVSSTYATKDDVDEISIGGRNLILDSALDKDSDLWGYDYNHQKISFNKGYLEIQRTYDENYTSRTFNNQSSTDNPLILPDIISGETYTLSVDLKAIDGVGVNPNSSIFYRIWYTEDGKFEEITINIPSDLDSSTWRRCYATRTFGTQPWLWSQVTVSLHNSDNGICVRNIKLEKASKPSDWSPAIEDLLTDEDVTLLETKIEQTNKSITALASRVEQNEDNIATIELTADNLTTRVSSTERNINELEIGGRNLVRNSRLQGSYDSTYWGGSAVVAGNDCVEFYRETAGNSRLFFTQYVSANELLMPENGETYTLSVELKKINDIALTSGGSLFWRYYLTSDYSSYGEMALNFDTVSISDKWQRFSKTYKVEFDEETLITNAQLSVAIGNAVGGIAFRNIKLEKGTRATDWTPAPEDMATGDDVKVIQSTVETVREKVSTQETLIQQLSDSISMLVTDGNGTSLMTQTESGWTFSTAEIQSAISNAAEGLSSLNSELGDTNHTVDVLQQAVKDLGEIAEYVKISTYEDEPCIELGESDSEFKLRITNTRILFLEGSTVIAHITNQSLHIKKAVIEEELQQGGFVWKVRSNGNMGLVWKGVTS